MSAKDEETGGPAFPRRPWERRNEDGVLLEADYGADGMMLRDYFAAAALTGLLASGPHDCKISELVTDVMAYADAMIVARNRARKEPQP